MSFVSLYENQLRTAQRLVDSSRKTCDRRRQEVRGFEKAVSDLEKKARASNSDSQRRNLERQVQTKSGQLDRVRDAVSRAENELTKAQEKGTSAEQKLHKEEDRDRENARRRSEQARKLQEQKDRLSRQREEREIRQAEAKQAALEKKQDLAIQELHGRAGELEERLLEAERRAAPPEVTVLFLASSPTNEAPLRLDKETREIQKRMRASEFRDAVFIEWRLARQVSDLLDDLNEIEPDILHFSGHGNGAALAFEDDRGEAVAFTNEQLEKLLDVAPRPIRLIVINSCDSVAQAEIAIGHVDIAIGMDTSVQDDRAQTFAGQFYNSLGFGRSVAEAFEQACFQVEVLHGDGHQVPKLLSAEGCDPQTIVLVNPSAAEGVPTASS